MDLYDDLDAFVSDDEAWLATDDDVIEPPKDAERANSMLRALRRLARDEEEVNAVANGELERIEAWRKDRLAGVEGRRSVIERALEGWMRAVNRDDPKRKSMKLPNGKVALRTSTVPRLVVADGAAFSKWERDGVVVRIAQFLQDGQQIDDDALLLADAVLQLVEQRPFGRLDVKPAAAAIKEAADQGPVLAEADGERQHAAVVDGEVVPGVALALHTEPTFSVTID